jgi:hypothetical protein
MSFGTVCAPGQRYHPAMIAQAAGTLNGMRIAIDPHPSSATDPIALATFVGEDYRKRSRRPWNGCRICAWKLPQNRGRRRIPPSASDV